jgi:hypothetical protein
VGRLRFKCPLCGVNSLAAEASRGVTDFNCPACGGLLEYESTWKDYLWFVVSLLTGVALPFYLGYSGLAFILVMTSSATLVFAFGVGVMFQFRPSTVRPKRSFGETGLNLSDKAPRGEGDNRPKN